MAKPGYFASRWKGPKTGSHAARRMGWKRAPENSQAKPLPVRTGCRPIALWKAVGRSFPDEGDAMSATTAACRLSLRQAESTMKRATSCGAI